MALSAFCERYEMTDRYEALVEEHHQIARYKLKKGDSVIFDDGVEYFLGDDLDSHRDGGNTVVFEVVAKRVRGGAKIPLKKKAIRIPFGDRATAEIFNKTYEKIKKHDKHVVKVFPTESTYYTLVENLDIEFKVSDYLKDLTKYSKTERLAMYEEIRRFAFEFADYVYLPEFHMGNIGLVKDRGMVVFDWGTRADTVVYQVGAGVDERSVMSHMFVDLYSESTFRKLPDSLRNEFEEFVYELEDELIFLRHQRYIVLLIAGICQRKQDLESTPPKDGSKIKSH